VFAVPGGHMAIIGDVTGHGALAARLTAAARHTLRTAGELTGDPIAAMAQLNRTLCGIGELALATAACVLVRERERGRGGAGSSVIAEIVAGGHPLPILTGPGGTQTVGREGMLLGWERDARWELSTQPLGGEDTLILYTDGVTDARRGRESFGEERLLSFVAQAPAAPQGLVAALQRTLQSFRSGPRRDDVAALALQVGSGDG
jgi:serine phosphatase RsbU (regulator of sigma subunit)